MALACGKRAHLIGEDFDVAMRMGAESVSRRDAIFVEHTNRAEAHVSRIDVLLVRERVAAVEPPDSRMESFAGPTDGDHAARRASAERQSSNTRPNIGLSPRDA
jgi:hypothetical protein